MGDKAGRSRLPLERLFAGNASPFHHRMGLYRLAAAEFYEPTAESAAILTEKQAILAGEGADLQLLETERGWAAFREFARWAGPGAVVPETATDRRAANCAVSLAVEPDYLLMLSEEREWRLAWASVCFPTRWSLAGKSGRGLDEIHGVVPGLNEQIGRKIDTFFDRLIPGEGWGRANWGIATTVTRNQHPTLPYQPLTNSTPVENVWVRLEAQHFCRLPATGAIAFGIRILNFSLEEVQRLPTIMDGLREQLRTMPAEVAAYKGIPGDFWKRL